jgi:hypothetical protein
MVDGYVSVSYFLASPQVQPWKITKDIQDVAAHCGGCPAGSTCYFGWQYCFQPKNDWVR